jgi:Fe-Mn family superoxide dismutase
MFFLNPLPYPPEALTPHISAETISFHYGKHHQGYVTTLNELIKGTPYQDLSLEDIVVKSHGKDHKIFNNAAQIWNHDFYWKSLSPDSQVPAEGDFLKAVNQSFGSLQSLMEQWVQMGMDQFGSGWVWLVKDSEGKLSIVKTSNADVPWGFAPLAVLDVWEHAYYLDYQNRRKDHLANTLKSILNWSFAEKNYLDPSAFIWKK